MNWDDLRPVRTGIRTEYWHEAGIRIIFDYLHPTSKGLEAWCEVRWVGNVPEPKLLTFGRWDLMGSTTVKRLADQAAIDCPKVGTDTSEAIRAMLRAAVYDMIQTHLEGKETVTLAHIEPQKQQWLLRPLLEAGTATRIIARGGATKSLLALAIGVTICTGRSKLLGVKPATTGPVLYLDWEADQGTHATRLHAMCKGAGIDVPENLHYEHHDESLHRAIHGIARTVAQYAPIALVVDSNAMARGGTGSGGAEDTTRDMYAALRQLKLPVVILDHKSDEKIRRGVKGGYGSVFNQNLARLEWEYVRIQQVGDTTRVALSLEKANNMRTGIELAFELDFVNLGDGDDRHLDKIRMRPIAPANVTAMPDASNAQTWRDRIYWLLQAEGVPLEVGEIAERMEASESTIRKELNRHPVFVNVAVSGVGKWSTAELAEQTHPIPY